MFMSGVVFGGDDPTFTPANAETKLRSMVETEGGRFGVGAPDCGNAPGTRLETLRFFCDGKESSGLAGLDSEKRSSYLSSYFGAAAGPAEEVRGGGWFSEK